MGNKILVTSEIATWVVNGVNKAFVTSKVISYINTVVVSWNEYAQYSYSWNTIYLDDAPSSWQVLITYWYESNYDFLDNTAWIVGEIMEWVVDSNNRLFTSFYPISLIDEVRVNGIVVTWYTIVWNTILLQTAPNSWYVEIDYFRKDLIIQDYSRDRYNTRKEIRDKIYNEISQDDTSVQYPISLVNDAIEDWVVELITHVVDKSRNISYQINNGWYVYLNTIVNSNSSFSYTYDKVLPPNGRLLAEKDGNIIEYSTITSWNILNASWYSAYPETWMRYFVGYRLPRNIKRVVSVNWGQSQNAWTIGWFIHDGWSYVISNGFIYIRWNTTHTIEIELNEFMESSQDDALIYVDREDVGVIVYYALRQVYQSRESDKLSAVSQLYLEKLKSYKRRMIKKRSSNTWNVMKTSNGLIPKERYPSRKFPDTILIPQIIIKPADNIDGWYSNN